MFRMLRQQKREEEDKRPEAMDCSLLKKRAQVILEFTFCMIVLLLMIFGVTKVFIWTGRDFAGRSAAHDATLFTPIIRDYGSCLSWNYDNPMMPICTGGYSLPGDGPMRQIDPYFYRPVKMNAIWKGN